MKSIWNRFNKQLNLHLLFIDCLLTTPLPQMFTGFGIEFGKVITKCTSKMGGNFQKTQIATRSTYSYRYKDNYAVQTLQWSIIIPQNWSTFHFPHYMWEAKMLQVLLRTRIFNIQINTMANFIFPLLIKQTVRLHS